MGRKRSAEDYQRTAETNGWVTGGPYKEEDSIQQTKVGPSNRYKPNQQATLDQWIMWVLESGSFRWIKGRPCLGMPAGELPLYLATRSLKTLLDGTASPVLAGSHECPTLSWSEAYRRSSSPAPAGQRDGD